MICNFLPRDTEHVAIKLTKNNFYPFHISPFCPLPISPFPFPLSPFPLFPLFPFPLSTYFRSKDTIFGRKVSIFGLKIRIFAYKYIQYITVGLDSRDTHICLKLRILSLEMHIFVLNIRILSLEIHIFV